MDKELKEILSLLNKATGEEKELVIKAYQFAKIAHEGEKRLSGEPYFNHLVETAKNIANLGVDTASVAAGFLHDILENTNIEAAELEKEFGKEITFIVEGVTKLGTLKYHGSDRHNESLRKLLLATSKDLRVLIVKLCDRLHNMQTLSFVPKEKQRRIAAETLEIYAPIATRLGIRKLSRDLEDLSFPYTDKDGYQEISSIFKKNYKEKLERLERFRKSVVKELAKADFTDFRSDYRIKGLYSLYKKYLSNKKDIGSIYDMLAMRIIVKKTEDCYKVLGIIHSAWKPLPGRIKDFISRPKTNGYQSLHTTVFAGDGELIEVQIRTEEMHMEAEYGVAAHSLYKAGEKNKKQVAPWIQAITSSSLTEIKHDFLSERIFLFTPKGDVVDLPVDSSVIDFAYMIHSDLGNHISGAKVNGKFVTIYTTLQNGDRVEIETKKSARPNKKWADHCKTTVAKRRIRAMLDKNR